MIFVPPKVRFYTTHTMSQNLLNASSVRVCGSVAAAGHKAGVLLPLGVRLPALPPLLPDGAAEHAVAALDVRGHDPLDSPKHLAHSFIQGKHTFIRTECSKNALHMYILPDFHIQTKPLNILSLTWEHLGRIVIALLFIEFHIWG